MSLDLGLYQNDEYLCRICLYLCIHGSLVLVVTTVDLCVNNFYKLDVIFRVLPSLSHY